MNDKTPTSPIDRASLDDVLDQQSERWKHGDRALVEDYLARYPALEADAESVLDLIYQEILLRRGLGESPGPEEYTQRFPAWTDALIRQFAVDDAMQPADDAAEYGVLGREAHAGKVSLDANRSEHASQNDIDGYEVLEVLGRGGMGVVFKARDIRLGRIVAIKMIADGQHAGQGQLERFLSEAAVVARVQHPHIIQVHAIGEHLGRPYFSLEFAEGGSLADRFAQGPMTSADAAELVETLAHAVHAAHGAGIVHRDLKPSNVLLTAGNVPKIADFGLAKLIGGDSARTLSGEALGTPSYMAPEQAEGRSKQVGPGADVYALGAILYHALTGRPPFLGDSAIETIKLVTSAEVVAPRRHRPGVPRDLETICLKCLEKDPRKRYVSADLLAHDLNRFRQGRPIVARPVGPVGRLGRWARRNPMLSLTTAALLVTFTLGTPALLLLWLRARGERDHAVRSRDRAIGAVRLLLGSGGAESQIEEVRPYRQALIAAGLAESQGLVRDLEGDPHAEFQRVEAYSALAGVQNEAGERAAALESVRKAIALAETLIARDPSSVPYLFSLASAFHRLAAMWPEENEYLRAARRSIEICQQLCSQHPEGDRSKWNQLSAQNHFNIANLHFNKSRLAEAIESLVAARSCCQTALDLGDRTARAREIMAKIQLYLCRAYGHSKQFEQSLASGQGAIDIFRRLVADYPDHPGYGFDLGMANQEIGLLCVAHARWDEAIASFDRARKTLKAMIPKQGRLVSSMARIQMALANADENLREAYDSDPARYAEERRASSREAYEICDKLSLVQSPSPNIRIISARHFFETACYQEEELGKPDLELLSRSEQLWAGLLRDAPSNREARVLLAIVRRMLGRELEALGRATRAASLRQQSLTSARGDPEIFYEIALEYAKHVALVGRLSPSRDSLALAALRRRYADDALAMLHEAIVDGFKDSRELRDDTRFRSIHDATGFQTILSDLEFPARPFAPR
jgi:tetratricopeptide (TPR) repeat protein